MGEECGCGCQCQGTKVSLKVNGTEVQLNEFVKDSLAGTVVGYLSALRLEHEGIRTIGLEIEL